MITKCNECGAPRQDMEYLHCPYCNERKKIRTELFIQDEANEILTRELARVTAACEVMREGLEKLSEFTDQSVYLITTDSLCRADNILGGGE